MPSDTRLRPFCTLQRSLEPETHVAFSEIASKFARDISARPPASPPLRMHSRASCQPPAPRPRRARRSRSARRTRRSRMHARARRASRQPAPATCPAACNGCGPQRLRAANPHQPLGPPRARTHPLPIGHDGREPQPERSPGEPGEPPTRASHMSGCGPRWLRAAMAAGRSTRARMACNPGSNDFPTRFRESSVRVWLERFFDPFPRRQRASLARASESACRHAQSEYRECRRIRASGFSARSSARSSQKRTLLSRKSPRSSLVTFLHARQRHRPSGCTPAGRPRPARALLRPAGRPAAQPHPRRSPPARARPSPPTFPWRPSSGPSRPASRPAWQPSRPPSRAPCGPRRQRPSRAPS